MVKSRNQYEVFSTVNGLVAQNHVTEGDLVQKGDVIISLKNEIPGLSSENARIAAIYSSIPFNTDRLKQLEIDIGLENGQVVFNIFKHLCDQFQQTLFIVTHDPEFAALTNRMIEMEDGKIIHQ